MAESDCLKAASGTHDPAGGPAGGPELDANWQDDWHPRPRPGLISAGAAAEEPEPGREPGQLEPASISGRRGGPRAGYWHLHYRLERLVVPAAAGPRVADRDCHGRPPAGTQGLPADPSDRDTLVTQSSQPPSPAVPGGPTQSSLRVSRGGGLRVRRVGGGSPGPAVTGRRVHHRTGTV